MIPIYKREYGFICCLLSVIHLEMLNAYGVWVSCFQSFSNMLVICLENSLSHSGKCTMFDCLTI